VDYAGNFKAPPKLTASLAGQATIGFSDCTHGTITYHLTAGSVRDGTIPLTRLGSNVTCALAGDNGAAATDYSLSGPWYDTNTSGQGLLFAIDPFTSNLFAAWYTFSLDGQHTGGGASQRWYTLQTNGFASGTASKSGIPIYSTSGGIFDNPATVQTTPVGSANISYQSCNAMTLTYTFTSGENQGQSGTVNLGRPVPATAACGL
jgi:hypothetical protein